MKVITVYSHSDAYTRGGLWFIWTHYTNQIEANLNIIAQTWTNEGDLTRKELLFITLKVESILGDLVGSLEAPGLERSYEAHIDLGCFYSTLRVSELRGRSLMLLWDR